MFFWPLPRPLVTRTHPGMKCLALNSSDTLIIWLLLMGEGTWIGLKSRKWQFLNVCTWCIWTVHWTLNLFILLDSCELGIAFTTWTLQVKEWGLNYGGASFMLPGHTQKSGLIDVVLFCKPWDKDLRASGVSESRVYYLLPLSSRHTLQDVHYDEQKDSLSIYLKQARC